MTRRPSGEGQSPHLHALYRFFSHPGDLLYVGVTLNPAARWKQHSADKPWWLDVANITVEPHPDRLSVLEAERLAIITERPRYNVRLNRPDLSMQPTQGDIIKWICYSCRQPIPNGKGYLLVDFEDSIDLDLDLIQWTRWHRDCDPGTEGMKNYRIDVESIRTYAQLLEWTAYLMQGPWLESTDWGQVIHDALDSHKFEDVE